MATHTTRCEISTTDGAQRAKADDIGPQNRVSLSVDFVGVEPFHPPVAGLLVAPGYITNG
jgi:hypothetical protein